MNHGIMVIRFGHTCSAAVKREDATMTTKVILPTKVEKMARSTCLNQVTTANTAWFRTKLYHARVIVVQYRVQQSYFQLMTVANTS